VNHSLSCWPAVAEKNWLALCETAVLQPFIASHEASLRRACVVSDYIVASLCRYPDDLMPWLLASVDHPLRLDDCRQEIRLALSKCESEEDMHRLLRQFRRRHQCRLIWRDLVLRTGYRETVAELSGLADLLIDEALSWCYRLLCQQYGTPRNAEGKAQPMIVLGMGKLGASELNVSSDIDLIFAFPDKGETDGQRCLDNQSFFIRLGQKLMLALDKHTADGFVFRVDMRLRPYGTSGALALSFAAMEEYYEEQGRDWERYAFIKARPVAGDLAQGEVLLDRLQAFVYRKYIDFGAIEALRGMKEMIQREVLRKGLENNIKLGAGGIREVEFIVQAFQLVRGGRENALQERGLLKALAQLDVFGLLPTAVVTTLRTAYIFLRNLEHAIQGLADKQTQTLPDDAVTRERVACAMGFAGWEPLAEELDKQRRHVSEQFAQVIVERRSHRKDGNSSALEWMPLWAGDCERDEAIRGLCEKGCTEPAELVDALITLRDSGKVQQLQAQGRARLDQFIPLLIEQMVDLKVSVAAQKRLLAFVETVLRRTAYLVLLMENPAALHELVRLFNESIWVADQILSAPLLLDELLHEQSLYSPPDTASLRDELRQNLLRIPDDDLEEQMEALRYFKKAHVLRVAASDLRGTLPLMKVSDYLTFIAETLLEEVVDLAWRETEKRYGRPRLIDDTPCDTHFGVVGYGKLGGIELSYGSDLDLVFLHGAATDLSTLGDNSIDNQVFFARLSQRIIHLINTRTASGYIYEVDMRLRPSGGSGMMVSSLGAFKKYQSRDAWTWEHQALVRARFVAGCPHIRQAFDAIRLEILCQPRNHRDLLHDVLEMRQKMRDTLASKPQADGSMPFFDLKQDAGGIVDIEFMVQYMALRWASEYPSVVKWSDNIRILESLAAVSLITAEDAAQLCEIYRQLRARGHHLALQCLPSRVDAAEFLQERAWVIATWKRLMRLDSRSLDNVDGRS
jgi:glutamate-ammonia-ligase adenylyltransferase